MSAEIVGVSFCIEPGHAAYVPLAHDYAGRPEQLDRARVLEALRPLLEDPAHAKLGQHLKFDAHVLANHGIRLRGHALRHDARVLRAQQHRDAARHGFDGAALSGRAAPSISRTSPARAPSRSSFNQVEHRARRRVLGRGRRRHAAAASGAVAEARADAPRWRALYQQIEQPLVPVLQRMERHGVLIDRDMLHRAERRDRRAPARDRGAGARARPARRSISSRPSSCSRSCSRSCSCRCCARPRAARPPPPRMCWRSSRPTIRCRSTDSRISRPGQAALDLHREAAGADQCPTPAACTPPITRRWRPPDGCPPPIRTCRTFRSARSKAGASARPSSRRRAIVLLAADYSQIELRIMAHLSGDEGLLRAFAEERDIHQATAAEVFGVAARAGVRRSAPLGQGHQLRPDLRHVGLRPGASARHARARGAELRRPVLRALSGRASATWSHARAGATRRLCRDGIRPAAVPARYPLAQSPACSNTPNAAPSTRRCRAPPPTSSSAR